MNNSHSSRINGYKYTNNCWKSRNRLEKVLILSISVLVIVVLALFICLLLIGHDEKVCISPECVKASSHLSDFIDATKNPCNDFYQFACGKFLFEGVENQVKTPISSLNTQTKNQLETIISEPITPNLPKSLLQQKKYYRACMNTTKIEEDANLTLLKYLDELGGWPVIKKGYWSDRYFSWDKVMAKSRRLGLSFNRFVDVGVGEDEENKKYVLQIKYPTLSPPEVTELSEEYIEFMTNIAFMLGAVNAGVDLRRTMDFYKELVKIVNKAQNASESNSKNTTYVTIKEIQTKFNQINWLHLINNITGDVITYSENDKVILKSEEYLKDLFALLVKTPKRTQANYIIWKIIEYHIDFLTKGLRDRKNKFQDLVWHHKRKNSSTEESKEQETRKDVCIEHARRMFYSVAEGEYIRRYTGKAKIEDIKELIQYVKEEYIKAVKSSGWMDEKTKKVSEKRLTNFTELIGGVDIVFQPEEFEKFLELDKLELYSENVIEMKVAISLHGVYNYFKQLNTNLRDFVKYETTTPTFNVNAFYVLSLQTLILPTPLLQGIFYNKEHPHYMNFGALGSIIAHEYTHGLGKTDGTFVGTDEGSDWWTNETTKAFDKASKCLIEEYESYKTELVQFELNGTKMLEENVADYASVNVAYAAYQDWVKKHGQEDKLPAIKYTPNQIYWLIYSNYFCYKPMKNGVPSMITESDSHAVPSFRVNGPLRNSKYFAEDFNCPIGSYMNPEKKCSIF